MQNSKVNFTLPSELVSELNDIATELNEKKSHLVAQALEAYFDYLDLRIAEKRAHDLRDGKSAIISSDEMRSRLGL